MLVTALSVDALAAGLAYGAGGIRLPGISVLTASAVSSLILALSLLLGRAAGGTFSEGAVKVFGFLTLTALGIWKLLDGAGGKNAEEADKNRDRLVPPGEAFALGAALSADSLAAGIGAGALSMPLLPAVSASFAAGVAALFLGCRLGRRLTACTRKPRRRRDKAWRADDRTENGNSSPHIFAEQAGGRISGFLLLILAASKLL